MKKIFLLCKNFVIERKYIYIQSKYLFKNFLYPSGVFLYKKFMFNHSKINAFNEFLLCNDFW